MLDHKLINKVDLDASTEPRLTGSEWTWGLCRCVYTLVQYVWMCVCVWRVEVLMSVTAAVQRGGSFTPLLRSNMAAVTGRQEEPRRGRRGQGDEEERVGANRLSLPPSRPQSGPQIWQDDVEVFDFMLELFVPVSSSSRSKPPLQTGSRHGDKDSWLSVKQFCWINISTAVPIIIIIIIIIITESVSAATLSAAICPSTVPHVLLLLLLYFWEENKETVFRYCNPANTTAAADTAPDTSTTTLQLLLVKLQYYYYDTTRVTPAAPVISCTETPPTAAWPPTLWWM